MSSSKKAKPSKPEAGINYGVNSITRGIDGNPIGAGWDLPPSVEKMEQTPQTAVAAAAAAAEEEAEWQNEQFAKLLEKRQEKENMARPRFESLAAASASQWGTPDLRSDYNYSGGSGEDALLRQSPVPDDVGRVLASPYGWAGADGKKPLDIAYSLPTQEEINKAMKKGGSRKKTKRRRRSRKKRTKRRKRRRKKRTKRRKRKSRRKR